MLLDHHVPVSGLAYPAIMPGKIVVAWHQDAIGMVLSHDSLRLHSFKLHNTLQATETKMSTFIMNNRHRIFFYTGLTFLGATLLIFNKNGEGLLVFIYMLSSLLYYFPMKFFYEGTKTSHPPESKNPHSVIMMAIFIAISFIGLALAFLFKKPFFVYFLIFIIFVTIEIILWKSIPNADFSPHRTSRRMESSPKRRMRYEEVPVHREPDADDPEGRNGRCISLVIYEKPAEAPNIRIDERLETLADGHLVAGRPKMARFHPNTSYLN